MNKKLILGGGVVLVLVVGILWLFLADISMRNPWLDGQKEEAFRGNLVIPVTASGTVEAARLIEIKSKASGQVTAIHVVEGQMVEAGEVLVELDPVDERRNVKARIADLNRAKSALEKAKITLENYRRDLPLQTKEAKARLADASARLDDAAFRWEKMKGYIKSGDAGEVESVTTRTSYEVARSAKEMAEAGLERAKNNEDILPRSAQEDVKQAEEAVVTAEKNLEEANLRLEETTVRARSPGMVYSILVREGEIIQSGQASLTGGTKLMFLADTSAMFVLAQIDEADIGAIREIAPSYARPGRTQKLDETEYQRLAEQVVHPAEEESDPGGNEQSTDQADRTEDAEGAAEVDAAASLAEQMMGLPVDVTVEAYRSETYQGVIERILPEPHRVNNAVAFRVRIRLVGEDLDKLLGLQTDLSFTTAKVENVVLVQNEALHSEGRDCFVFVPVEGKPRDEEKRAVEIGTTDGTYTEIKAGLDEGEMVFTKRPQKTEKEKKASA